MTPRDDSVQLLDDQGVVVTCIGYSDGHSTGQPHAPRFITHFYRPEFGRNVGRWLATPPVYRDDGARHQYQLHCTECSLNVERNTADVASWLDAFDAADEHDVTLHLLALHASSSKTR